MTTCWFTLTIALQANTKSVPTSKIAKAPKGTKPASTRPREIRSQAKAPNDSPTRNNTNRIGTNKGSASNTERAKLGIWVKYIEPKNQYQDTPIIAQNTKASRRAKPNVCQVCVQGFQRNVNSASATSTTGIRRLLCHPHSANVSAPIATIHFPPGNCTARLPTITPKKIAIEVPACIKPLPPTKAWGFTSCGTMAYFNGLKQAD